MSMSTGARRFLACVHAGEVEKFHTFLNDTSLSDDHWDTAIDFAVIQGNDRVVNALTDLDHLRGALIKSELRPPASELEDYDEFESSEGVKDAVRALKKKKDQLKQNLAQKRDAIKKKKKELESEGVSKPCRCTTNSEFSPCVHELAESDVLESEVLESDELEPTEGIRESLRALKIKKDEFVEERAQKKAEKQEKKKEEDRVALAARETRENPVIQLIADVPAGYSKARDAMFVALKDANLKYADSVSVFVLDDNTSGVPPLHLAADRLVPMPSDADKLDVSRFTSLDGTKVQVRANKISRKVKFVTVMRGTFRLSFDGANDGLIFKLVKTLSLGEKHRVYVIKAVNIEKGFLASIAELDGLINSHSDLFEAAQAAADVCEATVDMFAGLRDLHTIQPHLEAFMSAAEPYFGDGSPAMLAVSNVSAMFPDS